MQQIKLHKLSLHNFKGVRDFTLSPYGGGINVYGKNGTGKTTLMDAFLWLMFSKDSQGKSDFALKTLDESGQPLHGLDHAVEADLETNGWPVNLKKTFAEKWTKKRGSANKEFTGHSTKYAIDGVPVKKKEWEAKINEIVDEPTFRLLTSPAYFNSLHWEKRRQILLDVCGDVSDQEVIDSNADLAKLPEILENRSLDDHKKVVAARKKEINKRLTEIPARIDELSKSTQATDQYSPKLIKDRIKELEQKIEQAKAGDGKAELRRQKTELESELSRLKSDDERELWKRTQAVQDEIDQLTRERKQSALELQDTQSKIIDAEKSRDHWNKLIEKLRAEYRELAAQEASVDGTCPTCGQDLPEDQVQAAQDKFNQDKATKLKEINAEGKRVKADADKAAENITEYKQNIEHLKAKISGLDQQIEAKIKELEQAKNQPGTHDDRILEIQDEIYKLDEQLKQASPATDTSALEQELEQERAKLAEMEAAKKSKARIEELKKEERSLASEYEDLERHTHLMEQFVVTKVNMLEEKINSKFEMARFKLFEEQINSGIQETCETMYMGVPYGSGLNNGARINVGLDIIRTLSQHYGVKAPVFVDNAESITGLIDPGTQTIKMLVDGTAELTTDMVEMKEAANG